MPRQEKELRPPDMVLKVKEKAEGGRDGVVGRGWQNADGSVSIQLNPGVVLRWDDPLWITAFPK